MRGFIRDDSWQLAAQTTSTFGSGTVFNTPAVRIHQRCTRILINTNYELVQKITQSRVVFSRRAIFPFCTAAISQTICRLVNLCVPCLTKLTVQSATFPEGCLHWTTPLSGANKCIKCVRIVPRRAGNLGNTMRHCIKMEKREKKKVTSAAPWFATDQQDAHWLLQHHTRN